ncbi:MAG TPA: protein kinase [Urbifossiella sp.]|nr:protein kinase [Urbifossiella sp.]
MSTTEPPTPSADRPTRRRPHDDDLPATNVFDTPPPVASSVAIPAVLLAGAARGDPFDHAAANHLADAAAALLRAGGEFLGFKLEKEIGRGAYGRVYLARQADLAGRPVALKVTLDAAGETRALAQLQHTNIVPVYSFHRSGPFHAVCMPYLGRTTLAEVVRHVRNRAALPLSGKELHSTVSGRGAGSTRSGPAAGRAAPAGVGAAEPTLGWERVADLAYTDAVLTLAGELADGLAHAHARGILHRDLKPANVLLSDDGRAMLLDFGLAEDTKARGAAGETTIGGTVPYMAPEHLDAYRLGRADLDARCDVYGLGVIVFELLTGRAPFPMRVGESGEVLAESAADRRRPVPRLRPFNPAVSPAVESLVRKCLAANPADRYQTAADLGDDIRRHLAHRPLRHAANPSVGERVRKFARRWPRLASSGTVAAVALLLLAGGAVAAGVARERGRTLEARGRLAEHDAAFRDTQLFLDDRPRSWPALDDGLGRLHGVLARYDASDGDTWLSSPAVRALPSEEAERVRQDVGETFYLMAQVALLKANAATTPTERAAELERATAWNERAERFAGDRLPRAVREQRAALLALGGNALPIEAPPEPGSARDRFLVGAQLARGGRQRDAIPHLTEATRLDPSNVSAWFVRGTAHLGLEQNELAAVSFAACVALRPDFAPAWQNRGVALNRLRQFPAARADFDRALELDPTRGEVYVLRAGVRDGAGDLKGAHDDLSAALAAGVSPVRVHFLRAAVRDRLNDKAGAAADRAAGLKLTPADELSWVARGEVRKARDAAGALADADEALKCNPTSAPALQLKAHLLSEHLSRPADALAVMDRAVGFHPDYVRARAGRAVLLARAGKRDDALRDAKEALLRDTRGPNLYQVGCVYALTAKTHPEDKPEALRLVAAALRAGFGQQYLADDTDLAALRGDAEFQRLLATTKGPRPPARP